MPGSALHMGSKETISEALKAKTSTVAHALWNAQKWLTYLYGAILFVVHTNVYTDTQ